MLPFKKNTGAECRSVFSGIDPPRGVLLYGPPGTGKTMLAKAVAHHTTASFIRVVGSEFVQKYLGEGPRMVRDVFRLAKENSPAIIFIDEVCILDFATNCNALIFGMLRSCKYYVFTTKMHIFPAELSDLIGSNKNPD